MTAHALPPDEAEALSEHLMEVATSGARSLAVDLVARLRAELEQERKRNADLRAGFAGARDRLAKMGNEARRHGLVPCSCGRLHSPKEWSRLRIVGTQHVPPGEGERGYSLSLRDCVCGSTIAREER